LAVVVAVGAMVLVLVLMLVLMLVLVWLPKPKLGANVSEELVRSVEEAEGPSRSPAEREEPEPVMVDWIWEAE
jgi:hypothetical protein